MIGAAPHPDRFVVEVLLFAAVAEAAGARRIAVAVPRGATVGSLWDALADAAPAAAAALAPWRGRVAIARNERYARQDEPLAPGDVLALIPPVSGG